MTSVAHAKVSLFMLVRERTQAFDGYGKRVLDNAVQGASQQSLDELVMAFLDKRLATIIPDRVAVSCRTFSCRVAIGLLSREYDADIAEAIARKNARAPVLPLDDAIIAELYRAPRKRTRRVGETSESPPSPPRKRTRHD
ncbi:hypothetical protein SARC_06431 [Sphaeroforma arctica JP610]|uniref:Uncharacterized protein n=1 Tax=Sphaeroforma arctica JP610 TaxID=667725 RepID=A0A0L0FXH6_9EUKA|nr:hypothetical protein SARC_06431 [Sphaeroforma arctica JP610]KNC81256.1 hypothetical protein SARC_06431 [Sphaeroforma arctica JP610]|eukprot:XP_014155158.1 hypothetical protein SARC_06431 [Sphaeroforma arctica JP610]